MSQESFVRFQFQGGLADGGQLNSYEAGRFLYAAARLVYTVGRFQQDGTVIKRIVKYDDVDIRVAASQKGSYLQDICIFAAPIIQQAAVEAPIQVLISHFMGLFLQPIRAVDTAVKVAEYNYKLEVERTKQEIERTKQSEEETKRLEIFRKFAEEQSAPLRDALAIIKNTDRGALQLPNELAGERGRFPIYEKELKSAIKRQEEIEPYKDQISKIPETKQLDMMRRVKGLIPEIGVPLRNSADSLNILSIRNSHPAIMRR